MEYREHVLVVIPNLGPGGAQKVFRDQLNALTKEFQFVKGCVFNWNGAFETDKHLPIISLNVPAGTNVFSKAWMFFLRIWRLRALKKKLKVTHCISHLEGADYINILSNTGDRQICWIHGSKLRDENITGALGLIRRKVLMPILYPRAAKIVTVSNGIRKEFEFIKQLDRNSTQTIYNGLDVNIISEKSRQAIEEDFKTLFRNFPVLITHCRLARQKNLFSLLSIHRELITLRPDTKLVIAGDGELLGDLLRYCHNVGLSTWIARDQPEFDSSRNVYFLGYQTNPFPYLKSASLYIMTSSWEGFPLALCEAMACGLAVIAADCFTGPREIIAPEIDDNQPVETAVKTQFGWLMPLASKERDVVVAWANQLSNALSEDQSEARRHVRIDRIKEFDLAKTNDQTILLIKNLK